MKIKLWSDWILVEIEDLPKKGPTEIILTDAEPIRIARALDVGPGRRYKNKFIPMELKVGDRFPFFKALTETAQGAQLSLLLEANQGLIRESDVLFVIEEGNPEISL